MLATCLPSQLHLEIANMSIGPRARWSLLQLWDVPSVRWNFSSSPWSLPFRQWGRWVIVPPKEIQEQSLFSVILNKKDGRKLGTLVWRVKEIFKKTRRLWDLVWCRSICSKTLKTVTRLESNIYKSTDVIFLCTVTSI